MFNAQFTGVPSLKMLALTDLDCDTCYLSGDHRIVVAKDGDGNHAVFDLQDNTFQIYSWNDCDDMVSNHESCNAFFPAEVVKVSLSLGIVGGSDAN